MIDIFRMKVEGWMAKLLSFAGRVELVKTVLLSYLSYWVQSYKVSCTISNELERISSNFVWNGKIHAWSWNSMCKPKREGGLELRRVQDIANAAGIKLVWRLFTSNSLWAKWMNEKYVKDTPITELTCSSLDSGTWKFIVQSKNKALLHMKKIIGDGCDTSLWYDPWLQNGNLINLTGLNSPPVLSKHWRVSDIIDNGTWSLHEHALQICRDII